MDTKRTSLHFQSSIIKNDTVCHLTIIASLVLGPDGEIGKDGVFVGFKTSTLVLGMRCLAFLFTSKYGRLFRYPDDFSNWGNQNSSRMSIRPSKHVMFTAPIRKRRYRQLLAPPCSFWSKISVKIEIITNRSAYRDFLFQANFLRVENLSFPAMSLIWAQSWHSPTQPVPLPLGSLTLRRVVHTTCPFELRPDWFEREFDTLLTLCKWRAD